MEKAKLVRNTLGHLHTVHKHRKYVRKYCFKCGLYKRGLLHDLSKYSPTELFESIKYYTGDQSPLEISKKKNRYSKAWFHHKGRNDHHYQYWVDNFDHGGTPIKMSFEAATEMICDSLAASRVYNGKDFLYKLALKYVVDKLKDKRMLMHDHTKIYMLEVFTSLYRMEDEDIIRRFFKRKSLKKMYDEIDLEYDIDYFDALIKKLCKELEV